MSEPLAVREAPASYQIAPDVQRVRPGYKQTEVGVIPEDWEQTTIGDVALKVGSGVTPRGGSNTYKEYGRPFVRSQNIGWGRLILGDIAYIDDEIHSTFSATELKENDVLLNITGASIGRSALADQNLIGGNVNQHVCIIRSNPNHVNPKFINYLLLSSLGQRQIDSFQAGGNREGLNFGQIRSIKFPLPPTKAEQEAIAEALSDADALIEALQQFIAKKRHLKQGTMQELLSGKKRLPGFTGEWEVKRLGEICEIAMGRTPPRLNAACWGAGYKWLSIADLKAKVIAESKEEITSLAASEMQVIRKGTLLMSFKLSIGRLCFAGSDLYTNEAICSFNSLKANAEFLYYILARTDFSLYGKQAVKGYTLNKESLKLIEVPLPTAEEQTAIATVLSDMDTEIAALETQSTKTRSLKQGMMHNLLTGKIRLVDPAFAQAQQPASLTEENTASRKSDKHHNWAFNEAVVISVLADQFGKPEFPLGRKRYTKLSYLMHRKSEQEAQGYLKKAAGPYNPNTKYAGPEKIAQENGYVRQYENGKFKGFIAAEKIEQAKTYFAKWYGPEITAWLEQFRYKSNDDLERLATIDMAIQELLKQGKAADINSVRALIASEPEWLPKLERMVFSDGGIAAAIAERHALFGS